MPYIITSIISGIVLVIIVFVTQKRRQAEIGHYNELAYQMYKEDYLTEALKIHSDKLHRHEAFPMLYIKTMNMKPQQKFVFNPKDEVTFGRDKRVCKVHITDPTVSARHGMIGIDQNGIFFKDMNSSNGSIIRRGLRSWKIESGAQMYLRDKDRLIFGNVEFRIVIFMFLL